MTKLTVSILVCLLAFTSIVNAETPAVETD
jgi:hypothetical protein